MLPGFRLQRIFPAFSGLSLASRQHRTGPLRVVRYRRRIDNFRRSNAGSHLFVSRCRKRTWHEADAMSCFFGLCAFYAREPEKLAPLLAEELDLISRPR